MLTAVMDAASGNKALIDGTLPKTMKALMDTLKPEAAYFLTSEGCRTCLMVFDLKDPSDIPMTVEPLFQGMNAKISLTPVMNAEDLQKGLEAWQKTQ